MAALPTTTAKDATPRAAERVVLEDPEDQANGALDLTALYTSETFAFDPERRELVGDLHHLRLEPRALAEIPLNTLVRYQVGFTHQDAQHTLWVDVQYPVCTDKCPDRPNVVDKNAQVAVLTDSIAFTVPYAELGMAVGDEVAGVHAATAVRSGDQFVWQDVAPRDDGNAPHGPEAPVAPSTSPAFLLQGPYPFIHAEPKGPLQRFSVDGEEVRYAFQVTAADGVQGEIVYFVFESPEAWGVKASHGGSGTNPLGLLTNFGSESSVEFSASVYARLPPERGQVDTTRMHMVSSSGAHEVFDLVAEVTGPRIVDPAYAFDLSVPDGLVRDQEATLAVHVTHEDQPLAPPARVSVDIYRTGRYMDTVPTVPADAGVFEVAYRFDGHGTWTVEPFVASLRPSPHAAFDVEVDKGGIAGVPGPGLLAALAALGGALALRRR
jgi:hypothetical protein